MTVWQISVGALALAASSVLLWLRQIHRRAEQRTPSATFPILATLTTVAILIWLGLKLTPSMSGDQRITIISGSVSFLVSISLWFFWFCRPNKDAHNFLLPAIFLTATTSILLVMHWLSRAQPAIDRAEMLKTGGLASGAVVALYALWLNDRRRQVEESRQKIEEERRIIEQSRQELEFSRTEHDRERVANENFARAVELLGNEADQVRVGALHSLARLAEGRPEFGQTVADILCAYLRRPLPPTTDSPDAKEDSDNIVRELQVRRTTERLIERLVSRSPTAELGLDLDLTGSRIQELSFSKSNMGELVAKGANFERDFILEESELRHINLGGCTFSGSVHIQGCIIRSTLMMYQSSIEGEASIGNTTCESSVDLSETRVGDKVDIRDVQFTWTVDLDLAEPIPLFTFKECTIGAPSGTPYVRPPTGYVSRINENSGAVTLKPKDRKPH